MPRRSLGCRSLALNCVNNLMTTIRHSEMDRLIIGLAYHADYTSALSRSTAASGLRSSASNCIDVCLREWVEAGGYFPMARASPRCSGESLTTLIGSRREQNRPICRLSNLRSLSWSKSLRLRKQLGSRFHQQFFARRRRRSSQPARVHRGSWRRGGAADGGAGAAVRKPCHWFRRAGSPTGLTTVSQFPRSSRKAGFVEGRNVAIEFRWAEPATTIKRRPWQPD